MKRSLKAMEFNADSYHSPFDTDVFGENPTAVNFNYLNCLLSERLAYIRH